MVELIIFKNGIQYQFKDVDLSSIQFWKNYREIHFIVKKWSIDQEPRDCHFFNIDGYVLNDKK